MDSPLATSAREPLRILLTGSTGQVGGELLPLLPSDAVVYAPGRGELDLTSESAIRAFVRHTKPQWIINAAAYTSVDKAEQDSELATRINTHAPGILGEEAERINAAIVHFSTDYVFDGSGELPWRENDRTSPLNVYGHTKLAGEKALAQSGAARLIFRTSWVYGTRGKNFMRTILAQARQRTELKIVSDQFGAPTLSSDLAALVAYVISQAQSAYDDANISMSEFIRQRQGVFHATSGEVTSWFGFAQEFVKLAAVAEPSQRWASIVPILTADYVTPARRPLNSRLDCGKLKEVFNYQFPSWQTSAAVAMAQMSESPFRQSS